MSLYVFSDPEAAVMELLDANAPRFPAGTTYSTSFPADRIAGPHIQFAWDGTPSEASNREQTALRFTIWTPKGQPTAAKNLSALVRSLMLDAASTTVWRVTPGAGRTPGADPDTDLRFVTFTVNVDTIPAAVA